LQSDTDSKNEATSQNHIILLLRRFENQYCDAYGPNQYPFSEVQKPAICELPSPFQRSGRELQDEGIICPPSFPKWLSMLSYIDRVHLTNGKINLKSCRK
jgi:hypothetical protein